MGDEEIVMRTTAKAKHCTRFARIAGRNRLTLLDTNGLALDAVQFRSLRMWLEEGPL